MATIVITTYGQQNRYQKREVYKTEARSFCDVPSESDELVLSYLKELSCVRFHANKAFINGLKNVIAQEQTEIGMCDAEIRKIRKNKIKLIMPKEDRERIDYLVSEIGTAYADIKCKKQIIRNLSNYTDEELNEIYIGALKELGFKEISFKKDETGYEYTIYECKNLNKESVQNKIDALKREYVKTTENLEK